VTLATVLLSCAAAQAEDPLNLLTGMYQGVKAKRVGDRQVHISGPMTAAATPRQAAEGFFAQHGGVFNTPRLEVQHRWETPTARGEHVVLAYRQETRGKEVDGSSVRVRVKRGEVARVEYVAGRVAGEPLMGREEPMVTAEIAAALVENASGFGALVLQSAPEVVVLLGEGGRPDAWCWRVHAHDPLKALSSRTFYVDTALPRVIHVRERFHRQDSTTGTVEAEGTPLGHPWHPYIPNQTTLVEHRIPGYRVTGTVGGQSAHTFTNGSGNYVLALGQQGNAITLDAWAHPSSEWFNVIGQYSGGWLRSVEQSTVGSHVNHLLDHGSMGTEGRIAHADVMVTVNRARDFFKQHMSATHPSLGHRFFLYPNYLNMYCDGGADILRGSTPTYAMYFGRSLDDPSHPAGHGGCWTWGTHAVAAHEFGHVALFMVDEDYGAYYPFHEGYADTYANLLNNESVQGRSHWRDGATVREDPRSSHINCQYPVGSNNTGECTCNFTAKAGQLLSGIWLRIRDGYEETVPSGAERVRNLFGEWTLITLGGEPNTCNPAYDTTAAEILLVIDEDTAVINNIICSAFAAHGISCP
jgi:hypothetical protein